MASRDLVRAFVVFWWVLGLYLLLASVEAVWPALVRGGGSVETHAAIIATLEVIAALLFLVPRTMRVGGIGLLVALALAVLMHAARGHVAGPLLVYGAGVFFVTVHGPVSKKFSSSLRASAV